MIPEWFLVALSIAGPAMFWKFVLDAGDWSFQNSDIALVECEEEGIDYSRAPEWYAGRFGLRLMMAVLMSAAAGTIILLH